MTFEERLLERLKQHEPEPSAGLAPRRRVAPIALTVAVIAAAVAAVVVPSLGSTGPAASAAVSRNADGTVTVNWKDLDDTEAANRRLRELGVTNVVLIELSDPGTCAPQDRPGTPLPRPDGLTADIIDNDSPRTVIRLERIPPDSTVVLYGKAIWLQESIGHAVPHRHMVYPTQERYCVELGEPPSLAPPTR